jgi:hypothetical protein
VPSGRTAALQFDPIGQLEQWRHHFGSAERGRKGSHVGLPDQPTIAFRLAERVGLATLNREQNHGAAWPPIQPALFPPDSAATAVRASSLLRRVLHRGAVRRSDDGARDNCVAVTRGFFRVFDLA